MSEPTHPYQLVIVGGGLAGLTAGVRAAELGLRALILEQGAGADYPNNSRQSGGILHIALHDPTRAPQELVDVINRVSAGESKPELVQALAQTGGRLISWLQDRGAKFMRFNPQEGYRWCMSPPRALRAGIDWKNKGPDIVLQRLARDFVQMGGTLQLKARVTSLLMEGGRCVGVQGMCEGQEQTWRASHCLISDGGFQANRDLVQRYITPRFDSLFQRGARTGCGDGLKMAETVGAALTRLDRFYGHVLCADARHNDAIWPYPELDAIATAGIVIDESARRVVDEGRNGVSLANELAAAVKTEKLFVVFDQAIWDGPGTTARIPANPMLERAGGTILQAQSVAELAGKMGVPAEALERTLSDYNQALDDGTLGSLQVARSSDKVKPYAVRNLPLMAIPVCPGITYTMGGIDIDANAQVLDTNGKPISGLFAAGATTGGIEGGSKSVYIGGLIKAGSFGLLAAERVAALEGKIVNLEQPQQTALASGTAAPVASAESNNAAHGLARFPILYALVRYGKSGGAVLAVMIGLLVVSLGWNAMGWFAIPLAAAVAALVLVVILGCVEMVTMVTELLMPE